MLTLKVSYKETRQNKLIESILKKSASTRKCDHQKLAQTFNLKFSKKEGKFGEITYV